MKKKVVKKADKQEIHFRVIPEKLTRVTQPGTPLEPDRNRYRVCLEKGMQVIGKSVPIEIPHNRLTSKFAIQKNLFDFQIVFDTKFHYIWSLYRIDQDDFEQRIEQKVFLIQELYDKFMKSHENNYYQKTVDFNSKISLQFMVLIQSTADYILKLTATILPETKSHLGLSCPSPSKLKSKKPQIDEILDKGKEMMEQTKNNENSNTKQHINHQNGQPITTAQIQQTQQPSIQQKEKHPVSEEKPQKPEEQPPVSEEQQKPAIPQEKVKHSVSKDQEKLPTPEEQEKPSVQEEKPATQQPVKYLQNMFSKGEEKPAEQVLAKQGGKQSKFSQKISEETQKNVGKEDITQKNEMSGILKLDSLNTSDIIGTQNSKLKSGHKIASPIIEEQEMDMKTSHKQESIQDQKSKPLFNQNHKKYGLIIVIIMLIVGLVVEISVINRQKNKPKRKKKNK